MTVVRYLRTIIQPKSKQRVGTVKTDDVCSRGGGGGGGGCYSQLSVYMYVEPIRVYFSNLGIQDMVYIYFIYWFIREKGFLFDSRILRHRKWYV